MNKKGRINKGISKKEIMKPTLKDAIWLMLLLGVALYSHFARPRYAYVRSEVLINEYAGMKEARQVYGAKQARWQANLDTLQADYQRKKSDGQTPAALLLQLEQNARRYAQSVEQLSKEEDLKMTQAVLEQINSFIEQYGKKHQYTFIFGTHQSGNILYGEEANDITETLLEALNKNYNPAGNGKE